VYRRRKNPKNRGSRLFWSFGCIGMGDKSPAKEKTVRRKKEEKMKKLFLWLVWCFYWLLV
jgi:hypothetical protein